MVGRVGLRNDRGKLRGGVVVLRDITLAKQAEEELRVRDDKNRTILATVHEAFIAIDESSRICEWNKRVKRAASQSHISQSRLHLRLGAP